MMNTRIVLIGIGLDAQSLIESSEEHFIPEFRSSCEASVVVRRSQIRNIFQLSCGGQENYAIVCEMFVSTSFYFWIIYFSEKFSQWLLHTLIVIHIVAHRLARFIFRSTSFSSAVHPGILVVRNVKWQIQSSPPPYDSASCHHQ